MSPKPVRLEPSDAERYVRLRLKMLTEAPWAFSASVDDDEALDVARLRERLADKENAIFAVEALGDLQAHHKGEAPELVAAAGIRRMTQAKFAHRASLWGVYVEPAYRGRGVGWAVIASAIGLARSWPGVDYIDLGVSENAPDARHLYESFGFTAWGREPETTAHEGRRYDEIYMTLKL